MCVQAKWKELQVLQPLSIVMVKSQVKMAHVGLLQRHILFKEGVWMFKWNKIFNVCESISL